MSEPCKFEDKIIEMHGDIKKLVAEFKAMNGTLIKTQNNFCDHETESKIHRYRITILWFIAQGIKYALGGGFLITLILFLVKK